MAFFYAMCIGWRLVKKDLLHSYIWSLTEKDSVTDFLPSLTLNMLLWVLDFLTVLLLCNVSLWYILWDAAQDEMQQQSVLKIRNGPTSETLQGGENYCPWRSICATREWFLLLVDWNKEIVPSYNGSVLSGWRLSV